MIVTPTPFNRRVFLRTTAAALAASSRPDFLLSAAPADPRASAAKPASESIVKLLFESLTPEQRKEICFPWDHVDPKRGLLRTRVENNWRITKPAIKSDFYTADQQAMIRAIFEGIIKPDWHERFDKQLKDDVGGFGERRASRIFGKPGSGKFEFVMTGRHMTLRCDGNCAEHVAFGGPIFYGHAGDDLQREAATTRATSSGTRPSRPTSSTTCSTASSGSTPSSPKACRPRNSIGFRGKEGQFPGHARSPNSPRTRRSTCRRCCKLLLEPYRQSDRDEVVKCLEAQGGLDACHLAFYKEGDLGNDGVWDNWRLEGPSFVWYFRGRPHVHVWVNVADDPSPKLNSFQDSIM